MNKRELRRRMRQLRDGLPEEFRSEASLRIARCALRYAKPGESVLAYASVGSEVATEALIVALQERGCCVCLPRVTAPGEMEAVRFAPGDELRIGRHGIPEPAGGEVVLPGRLQLILVPGLAFDRQGNRLGYGGGYYDRYLRRTDARRYALAFSAQRLERIPAEAWDVPVDGIIDELGQNFA